MSHWICCNSCFQSASADRKLAVTTCGHIICNVCFQKGKQGECLICKAKCQVSPLSDKSSYEVKALFTDINTVATKHFAEISKVLLFQARHQKRLLTHYQERGKKLDEALVKMKQEMQQMSKKLSEQSAYIAKLESSLQHQSAKAAAAAQMSHSSRTPSGPKSVLQIQYNSPMSLSRHTSATNLDETMEVDGLFRKPEMVPRLSLISPPHYGRMGTIPHRSSNQNMVSHSVRSATVSSFQRGPLTPPTSSYDRSSGWQTPAFKPPSAFRYSSMSSLGCPPP